MKLSRVLPLLLAFAVTALCETVVEEDTIAKKEIEINWDKPAPNHQSPPHRLPSHPQNTQCNLYPQCNHPSKKCCQCVNDFRQCCTSPSGSNGGFCEFNNCQSCKAPGSYCIHSNQCCGIANNCVNNICCIGTGSTNCSLNSDCCQTALLGNNCDSTKTCTPCKNNRDDCTSNSNCCGGNVCGNTLSLTWDFNRLSVCCLTPGSLCRVGQDICCDTRFCSAGSTVRFRCIPISLRSNTEEYKKELEKPRNGWGSGGGYGSGIGWGENIDQSMQNFGWPGTIPGRCTLCSSGTSCTRGLDCCNGFICKNSVCTSIVSTQTTITRSNAIDADKNFNSIDMDHSSESDAD